MTSKFIDPATNPLLHTIIENSDFGMLALDAGGRIIVWNPWIADRTAVPEKKAIGRTLIEAISGIPEATLDACEKAIRTGQPRILSPVLHSALIPFTKPSQQMGRLYPVVDNQGQNAGVILFIHDVSPALEYERFIEDKAVAERRNREDIFQAIGHPTFILDREHRILAANHAAEDVTGNSLLEMAGRRCYEIFHGTDAPPPGCPLKKMETSGVLETQEMEVETLGGVYLISCTPLFDASGNLEKVIHIAMDITSRKRMEEALRISEERYRAFVRQSSEAICLFEIEHVPIDITLSMDAQIDLLYAHAVIRECNQIFAVSHGFHRPQEMFGYKIGQIFPRLAKENVDYLRNFIENGHNISDVETKELFRDGTIKYFLNSLIGQIENERLVRIWGAKQDITRIKKAEEEIRKLNTELEQRVQSRTAQLESVNKELEAFTYSVSHDLRAPLRAIDGYSRILSEDFGADLNVEGRRICAVISESARNMGKLIDDLLSFSRLGRTEMNLSPVDMATLARSIFFELTRPEARNRIDFLVGELPPNVADPPLIRQVWVNLISNAVKFSSKKQRAVIEVSAEQQGNEVIYSVRDNGAGFDMQYSGKLFGVFQRLHSTKEFDGTGVGLAIVQRIIHRHGGRVWAQGEVGKGAAFHFTITA